MASVRTQDGVRAALETLETALLSPVVSGELESWIKEVEEAACALLPELGRHVRVVHKDAFRQISREDNELWGRVQALQHDDEKNLCALEAWSNRLHSLDAKTAKVEPDEARVCNHLDLFVNEGLCCIREVRRLEAALHTWLNEAFQRDRGNVD